MSLLAFRAVCVVVGHQDTTYAQVRDSKRLDKVFGDFNVNIRNECVSIVLSGNHTGKLLLYCLQCFLFQHLRR